LINSQSKNGRLRKINFAKQEESMQML